MYNVELLAVPVAITCCHCWAFDGTAVQLPTRLLSRNGSINCNEAAPVSASVLHGATASKFTWSKTFVFDPFTEYKRTHASVAGQWTGRLHRTDPGVRLYLVKW